MCDFHSIVVRADGAKAHIPSNSHSGAVAAAGWRENEPHREKFFVECEWSGVGEYPGAEKITRGDINEKQRKVIDTHYTALSKLLSDPKKHSDRMLFGAGIFSGDQYADIRWRVLIHPDRPNNLATKLVTMRLHSNGEKIKSFDPRITSLEGNLLIEDGYEICAPALTKVGGDLAVHGSSKLDALVEVGGYLDVYGSAKLDAPALTHVGGYLAVHSSAKINAPALTHVGGYLAVHSSSKLDAPALTTVGGNLAVHSSAKINAPALTHVGGYLAVHSSSKLDAPALTTVGGDLVVSSLAKLDALALTHVGGDLVVSSLAKLDALALTHVGGYLAVHGSAKLDAPALTTVGGNLAVSGSAKINAPLLKK